MCGMVKTVDYPTILGDSHPIIKRDPMMDRDDQTIAHLPCFDHGDHGTYRCWAPLAQAEPDVARRTYVPLAPQGYLADGRGMPTLWSMEDMGGITSNQSYLGKTVPPNLVFPEVYPLVLTVHLENAKGFGSTDGHRFGVALALPWLIWTAPLPYQPLLVPYPLWLAVINHGEYDYPWLSPRIIQCLQNIMIFWY